MKHITKTIMTQIASCVKRGDDPDEVAAAFGIPVERVHALTGTKPGKKPKKPKEEKPAEETGDGGSSAADDFK